MASEKTVQPLDIMGLVYRIIKAFRQLWAAVLILVVVFAGASWFMAWRSYVPYYHANAIFSVSSGYSTDDIFSTNSYYDSAAAQQMATSFPHLIGTDMMKDLITAQLGKSYINASVYYEAIADTNLLSVTVRSTDPQDA